MAHYEQLEFVRLTRDAFPSAFRKSRILEIGSWDVNGGVRQLFEECEYVGVDIAPGKGVDHVGTGESLSFPSGHFDTVISCECFEHNPYWLETFINMWRMLRPGGLFIFTCALTGRREHGTRRAHSGKSLTADHGEAEYYRNLCAADFRTRLNLKRLFGAFDFAQNPNSRDLYFIGFRNCSSLQVQQLQLQTATVAKRGGQLVRSQTAQARFGIFNAAVRWRCHHFLSRMLGEPGYHQLFYNLERIFAAGKQ